MFRNEEWGNWLIRDDDKLKESQEKRQKAHLRLRDGEYRRADQDAIDQEYFESEAQIRKSIKYVVEMVPKIQNGVNESYTVLVSNVEIIQLFSSIVSAFHSEASNFDIWPNVRSFLSTVTCGLRWQL